MHAPSLSRITCTCTNCSAVNELTASEVPGGQEIYCSQCGSVLGKWRDLRAAAEGVNATSGGKRPSAA